MQYPRGLSARPRAWTPRVCAAAPRTPLDFPGRRTPGVMRPWSMTAADEGRRAVPTHAATGEVHRGQVRGEAGQGFEVGLDGAERPVARPQMALQRAGEVVYAWTLPSPLLRLQRGRCGGRSRCAVSAVLAHQQAPRVASPEFRGYAYGTWRSLVSAPALGAGGRRFKSGRPDQQHEPPAQQGAGVPSLGKAEHAAPSQPLHDTLKGDHATRAARSCGPSAAAGPPPGLNRSFRRTLEAENKSPRTRSGSGPVRDASRRSGPPRPGTGSADRYGKADPGPADHMSIPSSCGRTALRVSLSGRAELHRCEQLRCQRRERLELLVALGAVGDQQRRAPDLEHHQPATIARYGADGSSRLSRAIENCPETVMRSAHWWPWDLPSGGHQRRMVRSVASSPPRG